MACGCKKKKNVAETPTSTPAQTTPNNQTTPIITVPVAQTNLN
jgi:hypothetical protein